MNGLWILGAAVGGRLLLGAVRAYLGDPAVAWRELSRFPPRRVADLTSGAARITGRVVAASTPLVSPVGRKPCLFYQVQLRKLGLLARGVLYPDREVSFEVDDGTGRVLVRVPPPAPRPEPGDEPAWEVVCAVEGERLSRRVVPGDSALFDRVHPFGALSGAVTALEGIIAAGDLVIVAGYASTEIAADGQATSFRSPPTRVALTSAAGYRLAIVKPRDGDG